MKRMRPMTCFALAASVMIVPCKSSHAATPMSSDFTYQGRLTDAGAPANGNCDMSFKLFDAATGGFMAGSLVLGNQPVVAGLFTVKLNFGAPAFSGVSYWLEIGVRPTGNPGAYTTLTPRQPLTAAPYALFSAAPWNTSGNNISYQQGFVGVGTPLPSVALDVVGTAVSNQGVISALQTVGNTGGAGVYGRSILTNGNGVIGEASGATSYGVWGRSDSGRGVYGQSTSGPAVFGQSTSGFAGYFSGRGYFSGNVGIGTTAPVGPLDVRGSAVDSAGVLNVVQTSGSPFEAPVWAQTNLASSQAIVGIANGPFAYGVFGNSDVGFGIRGLSTDGVGVFGFSNNANGLEGQTTNNSAFAIYALGRLGASGTKSLCIDHPLDPENKFLLHYCTEAPEPMNAYSGTVMTDSHGVAWVALPDYFAEMNRDVRYTLTVVDDTDSDAMVQAKVARKIQDNRFKIRSSAPHTEVCWRIEAVRNDPWVRAYGAPTEVTKSSEQRGKYQHPELYGQPAEKAIRPQSRDATLRARASAPSRSETIDSAATSEKQWVPAMANSSGSTAVNTSEK